MAANVVSVTRICPPVNQLYELINQVPSFPLNNRQLLVFAHKNKSPKQVVEFYESFNDSRVYASREELAEVSEQVDFMRQQEAEMPRDLEVVPQED